MIDKLNAFMTGFFITISLSPIILFIITEIWEAFKPRWEYK